MAIPPRHPLIVAASPKTPMDPEEFVLVTVQRIKSSQLEEALLVLPFSHVTKLLQNLAVWIERSWNPRLTSRILFFLLRTHHNELVSTRALRPTLERIRTAHKKLLVDWKDMLGFNVAGLTFLKQELDARRSSGFMDDTPIEPEVEIKGKQRKRKAVVSR
jgi:U3 small nucleolar RNA-associated protein 12